MPPTQSGVEVSAERVSDELCRIVDVVESRLLRLIKEHAHGVIPLEDFTGELSFLSRDLQRCYRRVVDIAERRDLSFCVTKTLRRIDTHCVWLFMKIRQEQVFFKKLSLETRLRSLIADEAFALYQMLLNAEEEEKEFLAEGDAGVRRLLLGVEGETPQSGSTG